MTCVRSHSKVKEDLRQEFIPSDSRESKRHVKAHKAKKVHCCQVFVTARSGMKSHQSILGLKGYLTQKKAFHPELGGSQAMV